MLNPPFTVQKGTFIMQKAEPAIPAG